MGTPLRGPSTGLALALAFASGAAVALQAYTNGRLSGELGSTELAAMVNNVLGFALLLALGLGTGALRRAGSAVRRRGLPRRWHFAGGLAGALLVYTTARGAPEVGIALLTVAIVAGQTAGGLAVDGAGLSPAGRRAPSVPRLLGVGVAVVAVALAATGSGGDLDVPLLLLAAAAGGGSAIQQAANGQLSARSGEPVAAATVNFLIGATVLLLVAVLTTGLDAPRGWSAPAPLWIGGVLGMFVVLAAVWTVGTLGVLRLTLAVVSGQSAGALVIDLAAPAPGQTVRLATVVGVALTVVAVAVSGRGRTGT